MYCVKCMHCKWDSADIRMSLPRNGQAPLLAAPTNATLSTNQRLLHDPTTLGFYFLRRLLRSQFRMFRCNRARASCSSPSIPDVSPPHPRVIPSIRCMARMGIDLDPAEWVRIIYTFGHCNKPRWHSRAKPCSESVEDTCRSEGTDEALKMSVLSKRSMMETRVERRSSRSRQTSPGTHPYHLVFQTTGQPRDLRA